MCLRLFSEVMFHCLRYELYEDILKERYIKMLRLLHEFRNSLWFQKTIYILNKNSGLSFLCLIRKVSLNEKNFCEILYLSRSEGTSLKYSRSGLSDLSKELKFVFHGLVFNWLSCTLREPKTAVSPDDQSQQT